MPNRFQRTLVCVVAVGMFVGARPVATGQAHPAASGALESDIRKLHAAYDALAALGYSGSAVAVQHGQVLLSRGTGLAAPGRAFTADTPFDIASITKPVTAMAILRLIEQGKLSLDDRITRWIKDVPADKQEITIRQLVSHSSGLPDFIEGMSDYKPVTAAEMSAKLMAAMLEFEPGAKSSYSNGGFVLLGIIIEAASGTSIHQYQQAEIFSRAGVKASYNPHDFAPGTVAQGYVSERWLDPLDFADPAKGPFWALWGSGGLYISANDLAKLFTAFLDGRIVAPALVKMSFEPIAKEDAHFSSAVGWGVFTTQRGTPVMGHNGRSRHSVSNMLYYPESGLVTIGLSNSRAPGAMRAARELANAVLGPDIPLQSRPAIPGEPASEQDRALVSAFVTAMNASVADRQAFVRDTMTERKIAADTDEEIRAQMANYARRMGRPEVIEIKRSGDVLVALMWNHEGQQPSLLTLTMRTVERGGKVLIDDYRAEGVRRSGQ